MGFLAEALELRDGILEFPLNKLSLTTDDVNHIALLNRLCVFIVYFMYGFIK